MHPPGIRKVNLHIIMVSDFFNVTFSEEMYAHLMKQHHKWVNYDNHQAYEDSF